MLIAKIAILLLIIHVGCNSQKGISTTKTCNKTISITNRTAVRELHMSRLQQWNKTKDSNGTMFMSSKTFENLLKRMQIGASTNASICADGMKMKCLSKDDFITLFVNNSTGGLSETDFLDALPSIVYQRIERGKCKKGSANKSAIKKPIIGNGGLVWLYSCGAVVIISSVGLFVVWLIPIIPKSYYQSISQLLIALAVGSLTGDALLHLIPHALIEDASAEDGSAHGHSHGGKEHTQMVWKALIALIGIHLFFLTERITILYQNVRSKRKHRIKQHSQDYSEVADTLDDHKKSSENKSGSAVKLHWASKSRKYSGNADMEIEQPETISTNFCNRPNAKPHMNNDCPDSMNLELCQVSTDNGLTNREPRPQINGELKTNHNCQCETKNDSGKALSNLDNHVASSASQRDGSWSNKEDDRLLQVTTHADSGVNNVEVLVVSPKQPEHKHEIGAGGATVLSSLSHPYQNRPHGHHHGHSHDLSSVKAIAYTVIAGDGLHNFCDGIAIGAAFAKDIGGGLSTAIAVLCHELPHELGDFVVLLHAGMSIRTAIFYNLMSSIFCAAGMIIGVLLGRLPTVSSWIFMLTAGMFLYIALVDMIPELSTRRLKGAKVWHRPSVLFLWQNIGFILGAVIMLLIALYEDKIV